MKDIAASVTGRLQNKAKERGRPFGEVLQYYAIERLLYRLSKSSYANDFVLKGALLFFGWGLATIRPTRDIDFRGYIHHSPETVEAVFREICETSVEPDGMIFDATSIRSQIIQEDNQYHGMRVRFQARLGKAVLPIQIDIGFSDKIEPKAIMLEYPTWLDFSVPVLRSYAPETVVAEKFEALIALGLVNSRLKDFYDLYTLSNAFDFDGGVLSRALSTTFETRQTILPEGLPEGFSSSFIEANQTQWKAFLRRISVNSDLALASVIEQLKTFLLPPLNAVQTGKPFDYKWEKGNDWRSR